MERRRVAQLPIGDVGAPLNRGVGSQGGATLVELLTSTLFVAILMAMSYSFMRGALLHARLQEVKSEAQEATVMALDVLAREVRLAGFSGAGRPLTAIRAAMSDRMEVASDLNGDGDTEDTQELVAYSYDESTRQLMRATAGGSPQPLVREVPPDGLRFVFFDAAGNELAATAPLTLEERRRVRRVDVHFRVEFANPDPRNAARLTSSLSTSVGLRNP